MLCVLHIVALMYNVIVMCGVCVLYLYCIVYVPCLALILYMCKLYYVCTLLPCCGCRGSNTPPPFGCIVVSQVHSHRGASSDSKNILPVNVLPPIAPTGNFPPPTMLAGPLPPPGPMYPPPPPGVCLRVLSLFVELPLGVSK